MKRKGTVASLGFPVRNECSTVDICLPTGANLVNDTQNAGFRVTNARQTGPSRW
jgi:hypothetical protein